MWLQGQIQGVGVGGGGPAPTLFISIVKKMNESRKS